MVKYVCDRCGKELNKVKTIMQKTEAQGLSISAMSRAKDEQVEVLELLLCPNCEKDFYLFFCDNREE